MAAITLYSLVQDCDFPNIQSIPRPNGISTWLDCMHVFPSTCVFPIHPVDLQLFFSTPFSLELASDGTPTDKFNQIAIHYFNVIHAKGASRMNGTCVMKMDPRNTDVKSLTLKAKLLWYLLVLHEIELANLDTPKPPKAFIDMINNTPSQWLPSWVGKNTEISNAAQMIDPVFSSDSLLRNTVSFMAVMHHFNVLWPLHIGDKAGKHMPSFRRCQIYALIVFVALPLIRKLILKHNALVQHWTSVLKTVVHCVSQNISLMQLAQPMYIDSLKKRYSDYEASLTALAMYMTNISTDCTAFANIPMAMFQGVSAIVDELRTKIFNSSASIHQTIVSCAAHVEFGPGTLVSNIHRPTQTVATHYFVEYSLETLRQYLLQSMDFVAVNQIDAFRKTNLESTSIKSYFMPGVYAYEIGESLTKMFPVEHGCMVLDIIHYTGEFGTLVLLNTALNWVVHVSTRLDKVNECLTALLLSAVDVAGVYHKDPKNTAVQSYSHVGTLLKARVGQAGNTPSEIETAFVYHAIQFYVWTVIIGKYKHAVECDQLLTDNVVHKNTLLNILLINKTPVQIRKDNAKQLWEFIQTVKTPGAEQLKKVFTYMNIKGDPDPNRKSVVSSVVFSDTSLDAQVIQLQNSHLQALTQWFESAGATPPDEEVWFVYRLLQCIIVPMPQCTSESWKSIVHELDTINHWNWFSLTKSDVTQATMINEQNGCNMKPVNSTILQTRSYRDMYCLVCAICIITNAWSVSNVADVSFRKTALDTLKFMCEKRQSFSVAVCKETKVEVPQIVYESNVALHPVLISLAEVKDNGVLNIEQDEKKWTDIARRVCSSPVPPSTPASQKRPRQDIELFVDVSDSDSDDELPAPPSMSNSRNHSADEVQPTIHSREPPTHSRSSSANTTTRPSSDWRSSKAAKM